MNIIPHILIPGIIGLLVFTIAFFKWPKYALAGMIIIKPVIDMTWNYYILLDLTLPKLYSGMFVIAGIVFLLRGRLSIFRQPISVIWSVFLLLNIVSYFFIMQDLVFFDKLKYFVSIISGFIAFVLFYQLWSSEEDRATALYIFVLAGIFPILLWGISILVGNPGLSHDELLRIMGPYQNFWNYMFYSLQTVLAVLGVLAIRQTQKTGSEHKIGVLPFLLCVMIIFSVAMVYMSFSKTGWITLLICLLLWFAARRQWIKAVLTVGTVVVIMTLPPFSYGFRKTFLNEIAFVGGDAPKDQVFRGRVNKWERGMKVFHRLPWIQKLFGSRISVGDPENDYLRILWQNGIVGFIVYLFLIGFAVFLLIRRYWRHQEPLVLAGFSALVIFLCLGVGTYALYRTGLQWFTWGTIGFALSRKKSH